MTHLDDLEHELTWFKGVLDLRLQDFSNSADSADPADPFAELPPPEFVDSDSAWASFIGEHTPELAERLAVVLALVPQLRPRLLDGFFCKNTAIDRRFTEFGGVHIDDAFEPSGETLAFVLGGDSLAARIAAARVLEPDHPFIRADVVRAVRLHPDQPLMKAPLRISSEYLGLFTTGARARPELGADFPAELVTTTLDWDDLVLHPGTLRQISELQTFITHGPTLMLDWGMADRLRPGHRALFHGPPGTGKTMSVALLGKLTGRDVYRIDLSLVVSKYIGETEKNLGRVFDRAQQRGWILFFDEADALFGQRSQTKDAHDRYANQEVAYLLQRIESFDGIAILASNLRDNLDDAFTRRFESIVYFPIPRAAERLRLWTQGFSISASFDASVDLDVIANDYELSGGAIINVIRQVSLTVIADGERAITREDLVLAIRQELAKEGRS